MAQATGDDWTDVIRKALGLYKAAVDAHREGKAVGVTADPSVLDTEFVGFEGPPRDAKP